MELRGDVVWFGVRQCNVSMYGGMCRVCGFLEMEIVQVPVATEIAVELIPRKKKTFLDLEFVWVTHYMTITGEWNGNRINLTQK